MPQREDPRADNTSGYAHKGQWTTGTDEVHDDMLTTGTSRNESTTGDERVRVLLVAQNDLVSDCLHRALGTESSVTVTGRVDCQHDLAAAIERHRPDVVLVTSQVHDLAGLEAIVRHEGVLPDVPVLLVADRATGPALGATLAAGCAGFFAWDGGFTELVHAIHTVAEGSVCMPRDFAADLVGQLQSARRSPLDLTDRELEVLCLLSRGMSTAEIVEHLMLSVHTVRNHIRIALAKLGAHSRLEAVAIATRTGLVPTPALEPVAPLRMVR